MPTSHEGFSFLISFEQSARRSAWLRSRFAQAQKPVQAVLDEWAAKPLCESSLLGARIEISLALAAPEREALAPLMEALLTFAAEKGAHVEFARFPLDGALHCQVWDARKGRFVERPPDARDVKQDYTHVQKTLRALVRVKAPETVALSVPALACPCGAFVKDNASRCPSCQRSFVESLAVKTAPGDAVAVRLARESLVERGIPSEGKDFGSFALVRPRNAREWLDARHVLTRAGFTLLDTEELDRRVKFLADVATWPRTYPVGEAHGSFIDWTRCVLNTVSDGTRATLEKLGREHPDTLLVLARGLPPLGARLDRGGTPRGREPRRFHRGRVPGRLQSAADARGVSAPALPRASCQPPGAGPARPRVVVGEGARGVPA